MPRTRQPRKLGFLDGGGEMGTLIRAHDWAATPLGPAEGWPQGLKTAVRMALTTRHPVFIFWGPEHVCLYNDGYRPSLGPEKHPSILGTPGREAWAEIWSIIGPQIELVMRGEGATWHENQLVPIVRRGGLQEVYWTYSYGPIDDQTAPSGVGGVLVLCTETTANVLAERRATAERERLAAMLQQAPGFICILRGPDHVFEFVNDEHQRLFNSAGWIGQPAREASPDIAGQGFLELLDQVYASGERVVRYGAPARVRPTPDAAEQELILDFIYAPMHDESGAVTGIYCSGYDVSARKRAETVLHAADARFRAMADAAPVLIWENDATGMIFCNGHYLSFFGRDFAALAGTGWTEFMHPDDAEGYMSAYRQAFARREAYAYEGRFRRGDGQYRWLRTTGRPVGQSRYVGCSLDVTELHDAQEALGASEARYRTLFESIDVGFCIVEMLLDGDGVPGDYRFIEVNPAFKAQTGLVDAVGRTARELVPDLEEHWLEVYGRVALTGEPVRFESGSNAMGRWFDVYAFRTGQPDARRVAMLFTDITRRRNAELVLRELNETLERRVAEALAERKVLADIVETTDAQIQVLDLDYRWLAINTACADEYERIYAKRPTVGASLLELLADRPEQQEAARAVWARALAGEAYTIVAEFGDPALDRRTYEMRFEVLRDAGGAQIGAFLTGRDVTDRVREQRRLAEAEERLRQTQKLEALGQLTGGVAHDFNNLLQVLGSGLRLLDRQSDPERRRRVLGGMHDAVERGSRLTRQLLAYGRRQTLNPQPVDVARRIGGMREMLKRSLRDDIRLDLHLAEGTWPAELDPMELDLALLNLCVNARDAMPQGGVVTLAVENVRGAADGADLVRLRIGDTGVGMSPEVRARALEPFFTTKEIGMGSGLGLSQVYGFARQSGGDVELASEVGRGTMVTITLPRSRREADAAADPADQPARPEPARADGAAGRVLLVEDDEQVASLTGELLAGFGLEVTSVASAAAALGVVGDGQAIDIVVSDVMMPGGTTGVELARRLRRSHPELPVLLTTGYADAAGDASAEGFDLLLKPYRIEALAAKILDRLRMPR